jgi:hypothetical protein
MKNPFNKNNKVAGKTQSRLFLTCNPDVATKSTGYEFGDSSQNEQNSHDYFGKLRQDLEEHAFKGKPQQIYMDEKGYRLTLQTKRHIC